MVVGLENTNLRSKMTRRLRRCGVSGAPRLLHTVTRQEGRETGVWGFPTIVFYADQHSTLAVPTKQLSTLSFFRS